MRSNVIGYLLAVFLGASCMVLILWYPRTVKQPPVCPAPDWQLSCEEEIDNYVSTGEDTHCLGALTDMYEWVDELDDEGKKWHDAFRRCERELRVCKVAVELKVKDGR